MKRYIKFRVWDSSQKKFKPLEGSVISIDDESNTATLKPIDDKNYIQQSLCLYDIDGKEIFEGDIVDLTAKKDSNDEPKSLGKGTIKWAQQLGCFVIYQYKDGQEIPFHNTIARNLRVLRNILEEK